MANLKELTLFKEELLRLIITNPRIMQAVVNNDETCFAEEVNNPKEYLYKNIFPYKHTLNATEEKKQTYITMDFANFTPVSNYYKEFTMGIYVFTHKDLMRITEEGQTKLRVDYILQELDKSLNNARGFGIGKLQFSGLRSVSINDEFLGAVILYETIDFGNDPRPD